MQKKKFLLFAVITPIIGLLFSGLTYITINHQVLLSSFYKYSNEITTEVEEDQELSRSICEVHSNMIVLDEDALLERLEARLLERMSHNNLSQETAFNMLDATARITNGSAVGTGVIIWENLSNDVMYTYILTNQHVVTSATTVEVERFSYLNRQKIAAVVKYEGRVVDTEATLDLALIEVRSETSLGAVASFDTNELESALTQHQDVFISGCGLARPPFITHGNVALLESTRSIVTAFSIFGSSGGGVFNNRGEVVGLVRGISMIALGENLRIPEPNLTIVISGPLIRSWLLVKGYTFLLGDEITHIQFLENHASRPLKEAQKK